MGGGCPESLTGMGHNQQGCGTDPSIPSQWFSKSSACKNLLEDL